MGMLADYCWSIKRDDSELKHKRQNDEGKEDWKINAYVTMNIIHRIEYVSLSIFNV